MAYRRAGGSGLWLSAIGLGLNSLGEVDSGDGSRIGRDDAFTILDRALELGVTHWDTANCYTQGNSERILGQYFASRGPNVRDRIVLATKVRNFSRPHFTGEPLDPTPNQVGTGRGYLRRAVEGSLRRLQSDYIDLLVLHDPATDAEGNYLTELDETWSALDDLVTAGKVHYVGISNASGTQLRDAWEALARVGKDASRRIATVQNCYNLLRRDEVGRDLFHRHRSSSESEFLSLCGQLDVGIIPYWPLAVGALSGRYRKHTLETARGRLTDEGNFKDEYLNEQMIGVIEDLAAMAEGKGIALSQLAIAWLLHRPRVVSVIAGISRVEHVDANAAAASVTLDEAELQRLDEIVARAMAVDEYLELRRRHD